MNATPNAVTAAARPLAPFLLAAALLLLAPLVGPMASAEPFLPALMPEALEIELALSAAPARLREGAAVYALRRGGYEQVRSGTNHYMCFVVRTVARFDVQSADTLIPICYDEEGTRAIAPLHFDSAAYREQGLSAEEIRGKIEAAFASGRYTAPRTPGMSYMISPVFNIPDGKGGIWNFPPHFMFYAPNLMNETVDTVPDRSGGWLPWINNEGPHGMMIVPVGEKEQETIRAEFQGLIRRVERFLQAK